VVIMRRGQIVAAACEAAVASIQPSLCMRALVATGLSDCEGSSFQIAPFPVGTSRKGWSIRRGMAARGQDAPPGVELVRAHSRRLGRRAAAEGRGEASVAAKTSRSSGGPRRGGGRADFEAEDGPVLRGLAIAAELMLAPTSGKISPSDGVMGRRRAPPPEEEDPSRWRTSRRWTRV
jgi:hypothetical protein